MKKATYTRLDGTKHEIEYDENAPCIFCDLPVKEASMSGTAVCPWCDMGMNRDGTKWDYAKEKEMMAKAKRNLEAMGEG